MGSNTSIRNSNNQHTVGESHGVNSLPRCLVSSLGRDCGLWGWDLVPKEFYRTARSHANGCLFGCGGNGRDGRMDFYRILRVERGNSRQ